MGEFSSLTQLRKYLKASPLPKKWIGPGDDCAFVPYIKKSNLVISTDSLVEGIHFYSDISYDDLIYKTIQVNLSDLASKGATPLGCFFSIALSQKRSLKLSQIFKIFVKECRRAQLPILGGDTTASERDLFLNLTVIGQTKYKKLRSHARPGQILAIAGTVGNASAGLELLKSKKSIPSSLKRLQDFLIKAQLRPKALLKEGAFLASQKSVGAMMDLSDGLASDVKRLQEMSGCGFEIELEKLPLSAPLLKVQNELKRSVFSYALEGGEDYALLFSCEEKAFPSLKKKFEQRFQTKLKAIGHVTKKVNIQYFLEKQALMAKFKGFDHFAK